MSVSADSAGVSAAAAAAALNSLSKRESGSRSLTPVKFVLNWLPNVEFAGLWVAEQKGLWRKAGLRMSYTPYSQAVHPEEDVVNQGGNAFGFQSGAAVAIAVSRGIPIQALYSDTQKSVFGLTVMAGSKIKKLSDLRGKRVGYQPHELYVPETMLSSVGLKPADWRPVPVMFDINQLLSGRVDAFLTFVMNLPIQLKMQGIKVRTFPAAEYGFHFYDDVMFAPTSLIAHDSGLVRRVVTVVARGFEYAHTHVVPSARFTCQKYYTASPARSAANVKQQILELRAFGPYSKDRNGRFSGTMGTSTWQDSINILYKYGEISSRPNPATIYTNRFNPYR
ncbi:MAG: ABC transporter substrate-binding protein [Chloroflexota bacterium]